MDENPKLSTLFFRTETGREPVREWLKGLGKSEKKRIGVDIEKVRLLWPVGMPLVRKLGTDLWEIRSNLPKKRIARILFTVVDNEMVILNGIIKKSQKTPRKVLRLAQKRMDLWKNGRN